MGITPTFKPARLSAKRIMKNRELFDRTISILVKAYFENTLKHGSCMACAVGNLIAANNGFKVCLDKPTPQWNDDNAHWYNLIIKATVGYPKSEANKQIESTGYTLDEIMLIESSFEGAYYDGDRQYNGLMEVCDALMKIHEANETEITEAKQLFVKV